MTKGLSIFLVAIALIASSTVAAHAGGGAGSGVAVTLLDCYMLQHGDHSPYTLDVEDQFGPRRIRLGKAVLVCAPTTSATVVRGPVLNGDFDANVADHLKCYTVKGDTQQRGPVVQMSDPFGVETAKVGNQRLLCAPATKEVVEP